MKRSSLRRFVSATLVSVMVLGTTITGSAATTFSDVNGHWAIASINYGVANGFIKGYADGTFKPDSPVTRAEFSKMLNVSYGIENSQAIGFSDVYSSDWYYSDVRKAVAAGYINGYEDNTFRPNSKITRQEAAIMIASVIPTSGTSPSLSGLVDNASIADWARPGVLKVYAKGYMRGDNNRMYNPTKSLTRAEAATILSNIVSKENIISSDTTISTTGKVLADTIYTNDFTISKSLGNGSVDLDTCMVLGTLTILGGGESSVRIIDTDIHNMTFAKTTGDVRVILSGNSAVKDTQVENGGTLEQKSLQGLGFQNIHFTGSSLSTQEVSLIGSFPQLYVDTASTINSTNGTIANITITSRASGDTVKLGGTFTDVTFEAKVLFELLTGKISTLTVNSGASSSTIKLNSSTSIATAVINATKTAFTGSGTIARLEANANDITYETNPTRIVTSSNVSRPPVLSNVTEITIKAIAGLMAPVTGATPDTTITSNSEYTATVTWSPTVSSTYIDNKVYTATITITPKTGYTLTGVAKNFFTVAGATATNAIGSGIVTAVFPTTGTPATAPSTIVLAKGTSNPVGGVTNVAIPAASATDTTGKITGWIAGTADRIKFTVTNAGIATSTITMNGSAYTSGADYVIPNTSTLTIVVTTVETGKVTGVRTFTVTVASASATAPSSVVLAKGSSNAVGGVTNVSIPAAGATDTTGAVTGWMNVSAAAIKFTVTNAGAASSTITINGSAYTNGTDYIIANVSPLTIVVTTTESGRTTAVRTFIIPVAMEVATAPSTIMLEKGITNPVGVVTNVGIPAAGATNSSGSVTGWVAGTAAAIKFTVSDAGIATSTITINNVAYLSGTDYPILSASPLTIVVTTTETGKAPAIRTFIVSVTQEMASAPSSILLEKGGTNPVGVVTNVGIPAAGATNSSGSVGGWVAGTAAAIKFTVSDAGIATSTITINNVAYISGTDYPILAASPLTIVVTSTETGKAPAIRTFIVAVS